MKSSKSNKWRSLLLLKTVEASGALRQVFHPRRYYPFSLFLFSFFVACVFRWLEEWEKIEKKTFLLYSLVSRMVCCLLRANRPPCSHDTVGRRQTNKTMTTEWERMRPNQLVCPRLGPIHRLGQFDASLVSTYVRTFEKNVIFRGGRSYRLAELERKRQFLM